MKVGLYFGSFNPIHVGHLIIANHFANHTDLDQIWLVVSPQNPLKKKKSLLADYHRLELVRIAVEDNDQLEASNIEFKLEQPNYTSDTLAVLKEKHPSYDFSLIMGEDNIRSFHKWKNFEYILDNHHIYVYPRVRLENEAFLDAGEKSIIEHKNVEIHQDVSIMKISASNVRECIRNNQSVQYLLTPEVLKYVDEMNFYKK